MREGSQPAYSNATSRPSGVRPLALSAFSVIIRSATAPSVICEELPAVTVPLTFSNTGLSLASASSV